MKEPKIYTFRIAGVTMGERQLILKRLRKAVKSVCVAAGTKFAKLSFRLHLSKVKVQLRAEPENKYDKEAIAVDVHSKVRGWTNIGYVPAKTTLGKGEKTVPLNKILNVLVKHNLITDVRLSRLESFKNENGKRIYFCFVTIEYETE